ncbi:unnamed protein product [Prunus armeniaca]|uniref:Factor of DNA methylation 1-5/IDN2 domain-containing protein n=1 Tax=Prunus armeniaca TaxID=36596 RepID=A0A6J5V0N1_PRUAR|nr:unnamed protein product [Prunus armeniaca]
MSQVSEEMNIAKLKQNVRDHLEKVFLEQDKALAKSEVQKNDNKKKLEHIEAQKKELMKKLEQSEAKKNELQEKHAQSEAQKKELQKKHEQSEAQKRELQKKHEQSEAQKKELQKKHEQGEAQKKELQKKHEQSEAQKKELQKKFEQSESHNKDLQKKLDHSEAQKKELQKKLEQIEAQNNGLQFRKQREIQLMKQMYGETVLEKRMTDEKMIEKKKENEKLHRKIIELEKLCDQDKDQAEVKDVKQGKTDEDDEDEDEDREQDQDEVKDDEDDEDEDEDQEQDQDEVNDDDGNEKMKEIRKKLKETEEELEYAEAHNHKLIAKESELEEARKELIYGWDSASRAFIGVKRMGELESKPFQTACKRRYPMDEADDQAAALCSLWESYLRDSCWKPFKSTRVAFRQQPKITIDEGDEKLKKLKDEFGDEVYNAATTALLESKEYNSHHWREESIIKRGCLVFTEAVETAEKEKIKLKALWKEGGVLKELWLLSRVNWLLLNFYICASSSKPHPSSKQPMT